MKSFCGDNSKYCSLYPCILFSFMFTFVGYRNGIDQRARKELPFSGKEREKRRVFKN